MKSLRPLPSSRPGTNDPADRFETDGLFIDERRVARLISQPQVARQVPRPYDLALSASDDDFAGWRVSPGSPFQDLMGKTMPIPEQPARLSEEPGLGTPFNAQHRWWMAGIAGCLAAFLFALLLFSLSNRPLPFTTEPIPPLPSATNTAKIKPDSPELTLHHSGGY